MSKEENRSQQREIDKQLARARRLDYRKQFQTTPCYPPPERTPLEEAEGIVFARQMKEIVDREDQALERLSPQEQERRAIEEGFEDLKRSPIVSYRINRALHYHSANLDKLQQHDTGLMNPILKGLKKRPERQAKAERAIERKGINPGVDEYGEYEPLWERF